MTIHATLERRAQTLTSSVLCILCRLRCGGKILVVGSLTAAVAHLAGSSAAMFTATEHLVSASGTVAVASEIEGAAFASASVFGSSAVA
jgi:hypothetical protein